MRKNALRHLRQNQVIFDDRELVGAHRTKTPRPLRSPPALRTDHDGGRSRMHFLPSSSVRNQDRSH
jgi:hypothetical protein